MALAAIKINGAILPVMDRSEVNFDINQAWPDEAKIEGAIPYFEQGGRFLGVILGVDNSDFGRPSFNMRDWEEQSDGTYALGSPKVVWHVR